MCNYKSLDLNSSIIIVVQSSCINMKKTISMKRNSKRVPLKIFCIVAVACCFCFKN